MNLLEHEVIALEWFWSKKDDTPKEIDTPNEFKTTFASAAALIKKVANDPKYRLCKKYLKYEECPEKIEAKFQYATIVSISAQDINKRYEDDRIYDSVCEPIYDNFADLQTEVMETFEKANRNSTYEISDNDSWDYAELNLFKREANR